MKLNYEADFPKISQGNGPKLMALIKEFEDSGHPIAEVILGPEDHVYQSSASFSAALYKAVTRCGKRGIYKVVRRKDRVFLVKEEV